MKIAIYGDSYGCMYPSNITLNDQLPWVELLKNHVDITNYSEGGSSLYYSYKKFLQHKEGYDKNIVLGSFLGRMYRPNLLLPHVSISIIEFPEIWRCNSVSQNEIDAFTMYYKYVYNQEEERDVRSLIEKDIIHNTNTLYISLPETLAIVTDREREHFNYDINDTENMCCHLSNDSNQVLFNTILNWINTGHFDFNLDDYKLPNKKDRYKYYI